ALVAALGFRRAKVSFVRTAQADKVGPQADQARTSQGGYTVRNFLMASIVLTGAFAAGCATMAAESATETYSATLAPGAGITSSGAGTGAFTFDPETKVLTYTVDHHGLSGPAMAAHI